MQGNPDPRSTEPPSFDDAWEQFARVIANLKDQEAFTWSPKSGRQYNFKIPGHALGLHQELIDGNRNFRPDRPIYLIGITNNTNLTKNMVLRCGYEKLLKKTRQPLFGLWFDDDGYAYLDDILPVQFINEDDAVRMGKRYEQKEIVRIRPNGKYATIKVR